MVRYFQTEMVVVKMTCENLSYHMYGKGDFFFLKNIVYTKNKAPVLPTQELLPRYLHKLCL